MDPRPHFFLQQRSWGWGSGGGAGGLEGLLKVVLTEEGPGPEDQQTCPVHMLSSHSYPKAYTADLSVTSGLLRTQTSPENTV